MRSFIIPALAAAMAAAPAVGVSAQGNNVLKQQGGLVNVNIEDVTLLTDFANGNEIEILNNANITVPITVQAPLKVAALVCGVDVNVLARGGPSRNSCSATQGSEVLTDIAIRQIQAHGNH